MSWKCPNCGYVNKNDKRSKCESCEKGINPSKQQPSKDQQKPSSGTSKAINYIIHIILLFAAPLAALYIFWPLLVAQQITIYAAILLIVGTLGMYAVISKHGLLVGIVVTGIVFLIYLILIGLIDICATGNVQPLYNIILGLTPAAIKNGEGWKESALSNLQTANCYCSSMLSNPTGLTSTKCTGGTNTNGNTPKTNKALADYKFIDVKFGIKTGDTTTEYRILNPIRNEHVFVAQVSVANYDDHDVSDITISGYLLNESGDRIPMTTERCLTADEHCQVGPGKPSLQVTLRSSKPVDFQANTIVYFVAEVSYPMISQGSNEFKVVRSYGDLGALGDLSKNLAPGLGPLDTVVYFSTPYYVVGSSKDNPDAASITIFSDIINGKMKNYGETGYGKIATIKVNHLSDIQIPSSAVTCVTPDGDKFGEGEVFEVGGGKVTNIQEYSCSFTVPDASIQSATQGIKFLTTISYNYTDVKKSDAFTVCPSDPSRAC